MTPIGTGIRYDGIGKGYSLQRVPDPRIARQISLALGSASTVLNVGAGTGSYEPADRQVTAIEPSIEMIRQRKPGSAVVIKGSSERLPFETGQFEASMAILTVHHWKDQKAGLREMRRVTNGPVVVLTFDPAARPWLIDYLPQLAELDEQQMPTMSEFEEWLGPISVVQMPIPHDCSDGFLHAYWRRPWSYLDPIFRAGSSSFWLLDDVDAGLSKLSQDLESGEWGQRYSHLLNLTEYDAGYRLIIAG